MAQPVRDSFRHLPASISSFVGREEELAQLTTLVDGHRLLTLTGIGGAGKTRLALQAASRVVSLFGDGGAFVDLARVRDVEAIPDTFADAFGVGERSPRPLIEALADHLADLEILLIVDNCEHLVSAVAGLLQRLLESAPRMRILATSRVPLGIPGEALFSVLPLATDVGGRVGAAPSEAVRLFLTRATEAGAALGTDEETFRVAAQICRQLEGLPLAVELAAARARTLSLEEIASRLAHRYGFLRSDAAGRPERHRTLGAAMDWSYELLTDEDQRAFRRLAVFAGEFTLDASAAVVVADPVDTLDALERLVAASLVTSDPTTKQTRFRLLETVREYGAARLDEETGETPDARRRHAAFFLELVERAAEAVDTAQEPFEFARVRAVHDNLRAALEWLFETEKSLGVALVAALGRCRYWRLRGHRREGQRWAERALEVNTAPDATRADLLALQGSVSYLLGDVSRSMHALEEAIAVAREIDDPKREARLMRYMAWGYRALGEFSRAKHLLSEMLHMTRENGDRAGEGWALSNLEDTAVMEGRLEEFELFASQLDVLIADSEMPALSLAHIDTRAWGAFVAGDPERAERLALEGLALAYDQGDLWHTELLLLTLAAAARTREDSAVAIERALEATRVAWELRDMEYLPILLDLLAGIQADRGRHEHAARLLGAASVIRNEHPMSVHTWWGPFLQQIEDQVRERLGDQRWSRARAAGRAVPTREAVRSALSTDVQPPVNHHAARRPALAPDHFARIGDSWSVGFRGETMLLKDSKGTRHLARLLMRPDVEIHALELVAMERGAAPKLAAPRDVDGAELSTTSGEGTGPLIDERARAAYKARVQELAQDLQEAEADQDLERAARAREEMDVLAEELARSFGLGGRSRTASSDAERARMAVTRTIRGVIAKIAETCPRLGWHLRSAVTTGLFCSYRPDPADRPGWHVNVRPQEGPSVTS